MAANRAIRASDQDREHVVEILRAQYSEGRLAMAEFEERVDAAYASKTWGDLADLASDLPAEVRFGADPAAAPYPERPRRRPPPGWLPRLVPVLPLLLALLAISSIAWGGFGGAVGRHHHVLFVPWPLLIVGLIFLRRGLRWRGGQWPRGRV